MELGGAPVFVTGASGWLGRRLVAALAARGAAVHAERVDVRDPAAIRTALAAARPRAVFHLAGHLARDRRWDAGGEPFTTNVLGTLNVLLGAAAAGAAVVVCAGTLDEYGPQPGPLHEGLREAPATPYAASKAAATDLVRALARAGAAAGVVVRLPLVYGPGQREEFLLPALFAAARAGRPFAASDGTQRREPLFLDDAVAALLAAADPTLAGRVLHAGGGEPITVRDLLDRARAACGGRVAVTFGAHALRPGESRHAWLAPEATRVPGWSPRVPLDRGLQLTWGRS